MADSAAAKPWPHKTNAIAARIIPWAGDTLGVAYDSRSALTVLRLMTFLRFPARRRAPSNC